MRRRELLRGAMTAGAAGVMLTRRAGAAEAQQKKAKRPNVPPDRSHRKATVAYYREAMKKHAGP